MPYRSLSDSWARRAARPGKRPGAAGNTNAQRRIGTSKRRMQGSTSLICGQKNRTLRISGNNQLPVMRSVSVFDAVTLLNSGITRGCLKLVLAQLLVARLTTDTHPHDLVALWAALSAASLVQLRSGANDHLSPFKPETCGQSIQNGAENLVEAALSRKPPLCFSRLLPFSNGDALFC